jgi:hypothetical protein
MTSGGEKLTLSEASNCLRGREGTFLGATNRAPAMLAIKNAPHIEGEEDRVAIEAHRLQKSFQVGGGERLPFGLPSADWGGGWPSWCRGRVAKALGEGPTWGGWHGTVGMTHRHSIGSENRRSGSHAVAPEQALVSALESGACGLPPAAGIQALNVQALSIC